MKKIASLIGAGALLLTMAVPAFGFWRPSPEIEVSNHAMIINDTTTRATSGDVEVGGKFVFGGTYNTGLASSAAVVYNDVNYTEVNCSWCSRDVEVKNSAFVMNDTYTRAASGEVEVGGYWVGSPRATTGGAGASSVINNFVNTTVVGAIVH